MLWCAYLVRHVLLLIYVSGLLAVGFSPIIRLIERQKVLPIGTARFPRWLAILILYLVIIGTMTLIGVLVIPPVIHQAQQLWSALPGMFERAQAFGGLFGVVTVLILTFYLLVEADSLRAVMLQLFPAQRRARVDVVSRDT